MPTWERVQPLGLHSHCGWGELSSRLGVKIPFQGDKLMPALPREQHCQSRELVVFSELSHRTWARVTYRNPKAATPLENLITAWVIDGRVYTYTHPRSQGHMHAGQNYIHSENSWEGLRQLQRPSFS